MNNTPPIADDIPINLLLDTIPTIPKILASPLNIKKIEVVLAIPPLLYKEIPKTIDGIPKTAYAKLFIIQTADSCHPCNTCPTRTVVLLSLFIMVI